MNSQNTAANAEQEILTFCQNWQCEDSSTDIDKIERIGVCLQMINWEQEKEIFVGPFVNSA